MDIKCNNCGQFFDGADKFCRFCGCPNKVAEEKEKEKALPILSKRAIEDKIQEEKTVIVDGDIDVATELDYSLIKTKRKGELFSLRIRSIIVMAIAILVAVGGVVSAIMLKGVKASPILLTMGIVLSIVLIFFCMAVVAGRYFMIMTYSTIKENTMIVPKYGLKKTPIFMLGGFVFEMDVNMVCPVCDQEVKGDLHIEKINGRPVAVCNYNRKHIFNIGESKFFEYYIGSVRGSLESVNIAGKMVSEGDESEGGSVGESMLGKMVSEGICAEDGNVDQAYTLDDIKTATSDTASVDNMAQINEQDAVGDSDDNQEPVK